MSKSSRPSFEPEDDPLQEIAGIGRNRRFDEVLDDGESLDIQVVFRCGELEVPLAKPSHALYFGDRLLYAQEARRFYEEEKARILNTEQFSRNLSRFEDLKRSCKRGFVIPFVGAGMSKSAGCPEWKEYLVNLCGDARLDQQAVCSRLEEKSDYEGVLEDLVEALGEAQFNLDFERDFKTPEDITGAVTLLPDIFDNCCVTTNFDRVLEKVYEKAAKPFMEKVTGRGHSNTFFRAISTGDRYLLKLHGNIDNAAERVLRKAEYDASYGNAGNIDLESPLPTLLKRLFTSYTLLFLGCSLSADRTVRTFVKVAQKEGQDNLPHHYALLPSPADSEKRHNFSQRLANAHISPLWYPEGEHGYVEQILSLLLDE